MTEFRCLACSRYLFKYMPPAKIEIKCRCKRINLIEGDEVRLKPVDHRDEFRGGRAYY